MAYYPATTFVPQFTNDAGVPLSGGSITAYLAGTTTPTNMFIDGDGASAGSVVSLNARGEPVVSGNTVVIWLDGAVTYKFVLRDASSNTKWTIDDIATQTAAGGIARGELARIVNSIAELKALDKAQNSRVFVTGYFVAGDGGGGHYWYDSSDTASTDNGGTIIVAADGARWKLIHHGKIHVAQFGNNLQSAITHAPAFAELFLGAGPYTANFSLTRSNITIRGCGMPYYNAGKTGLTGGGTIIQGMLRLTGSNIHIENLGIDCGSTVCTAINGGTGMDALVLNDTARQPLYNCTVRDVIAILQSPTAAYHNFLLEGCDSSRFENLHARYGQWGIVMKTTNSTADGLYAYACSQAGFTFKSDTGVNGAPALRSSATNVHVDADDYATPANGILIYAATNSLYDFELSNFTAKGPNGSGLKLLCDTRAVFVNLIRGVAISNGVIRGARDFGFESFGAIMACSLSDVVIEETVSNKAVKVWSDCYGISLTSVQGHSPAVNSLNFDVAGRFTLENIVSTVQGSLTTPSGINIAPDSADAFTLGTYFGTFGYNGSQTWTPAFTGLTVVNGTGGATYAGTYQIVGKLIKFRVTISVTGTCTTASTAATTYINNLPFTVTQPDALTAISGTVTNGGVGLCQNGTTSGYTPTWGAYNGTMVISGQYQFQP